MLLSKCAFIKCGQTVQDPGSRVISRHLGVLIHMMLVLNWFNSSGENCHRFVYRITSRQLGVLLCYDADV